MFGAVAPFTYRGEAGVGIYVASAAAVSQLAGSIKSPGAIDFSVLISLVVVRMASGAIRLVRGGSPCQKLTVIGMAVATPDARSVPAREIGR